MTASFFCGLHTTFGTLFQTLYGTSTQIRDKTKPCRPQSGLSRAPAPTFIPAVSTAAKSLSPFAGVTLYKDIEKAVQSFSLRHRFVFEFLLFIRGYPYTFCPLPPILDSRQDTVSRLPDFRLHTQISDLPAR